MNVQQSSYYDMRGNLLWTEPMMMSRLDGVGDILVHDRVAYRVQRVAVAGCVQIVNLRVGTLPVWRAKMGAANGTAHRGKRD